jgi:two-component system cell cycle response regulator
MNPMDMSKFEKLKASGNLPSPKGVALAILRLTQKEDASMAELARIIKTDPAFVGRLIKAANSVNANPGRPVVSVQEALVVLGMPAVRNLSLGFSLLSQYKPAPARVSTTSNSGRLAGLRHRPAGTDPAHARGPARGGLFRRPAGAGRRAGAGDALRRRICRPAAHPRKKPGGGPGGLEAEKFAMNHRGLTAAMLADWGLPKIFCEVVEGHETCEKLFFARADREARLLHSLALARHIAAICVAADEARAALHAAAARIRRAAVASRARPCWNCATAWCASGRSGPRCSACRARCPASACWRSRGPKRRRSPRRRNTELPARLRVLVVDDERAVRLAVRAMLEDAGYDVFEAADGQEGLRLALEASRTSWWPTG